MMTLANYGIGSGKQKDPNSAKVLSKSLQIRNRAELMLKQHLKSYFRITPEKKNEILNLIQDYYSRIPFNTLIWNKYQTKQCIIDSILLLDAKFNPYKAREAFIMVERMLINLVYLPWHAEFKKIHTYSGQFRLSISEPMIGIEEVFKAAGFQQSADCPMHLVLPDSRMPQVDDGESVTGVIFDCMIAQMVCSNIINVFENCCKQSKQYEENMIDINYYSWIQAYFRERSHQTTERACSSIQELLNNITNHFSKIDVTLLKLSDQTGPANMNQVTTIADKNEERSIPKILTATNSAETTRDSPKLSAQEKTRELLAQQSRGGDETSSALPNDLLRLPLQNPAAVSTTTSSVDVGLKRAGRYNDYDIQQSSSVRPSHLDCVKQQITKSSLNNGYKSDHYHQQVLYDRIPLSKQSSIESRDAVDYYNGLSNNPIYRSNHDSLIPSIDSDLSHSDRESLLPRYADSRARITAAHHQAQSKRNSLYDNDFDTNNDHLIKSNGSGHSSRYHFDEPYFHESTSHPMPLTSNHPSLRGSSLLKYNNSPYRKYESRDTDCKQSNSRCYWSCGSCTYNNQISSEICEMCRNHRPSH